MMLGETSIVVNGRAQPIAAPRPRLLLAMLASRYNSVVTEDAMTEAIWADHPPPSARTALQTYISALRDLLEPDRPRRSPGRFITTDRRGYTLRLTTPADFDVAQFEDLIELARRRHNDDSREAIGLLDEALTLWADPPFAEFSDEPWALGASAHLRDLHASALESRVGLALDDGTESAVLERMESAVAAYPYRERLAGQYMLALYRQGDQRGALAQYASTRRHLLEDLGLDPGRELQLLERAILAQDPALRSRGVAPISGASVHSATAPRAQALVGRDRELADVVRLLDHERCITIVGPGGVGKSSLAANVSNAVGSLFGAHIHHVDLADLGGGDVLRNLAAAMRVVEHQLAPLADSITDAVGDEPTLLVVETCEVAPEEAGTAISSVLAAPGLRVIATSQVPLHIQAEHVYRLEPLPPDAAVAVLTRSRNVGDGTLPTLRAIADRLDRLPLSLELASTRLDALGADELLRSISERDSSVVGATDRPTRHRSARAAVEWSMQFLEPDQRQMLTVLAAFSAPFSLDAVRSVSDDEGRVGAVVGDLVDRSLIARVPGHAARFRVSDSVRDVVVATVDASVIDGLRTRLAEASLESAQAVMFGTSSRVDLDDLRGEVVPALRRFEELDDARQLTLAGLLGMFFIEQGRISEGREQLARALESHREAPDVLRLLSASQLGFLTWYQGDMAATQRVLSSLAELLESSPNATFTALVNGSLAFVEHRFDDAASSLCRAADEARGDTRQRLLILHMAGNACWYSGDPRGAAARYRTQRDVAQALDDDFQLAQALRFEAMVTAQLGDIERAWRWAERSLAMSRVMADSVSLAQSGAASAVVASVAGVELTATENAADAIRAARRHFDVFALRTALPIIARASAHNDDPTTAARLLGWYLDLLDRTGQTPSPATPDVHATIDQVRESLGRVEFAQVSARGAAGQLMDVIADANRVRSLVRDRGSPTLSMA